MKATKRKRFNFNPRYSETQAAKDTLIVVRACGSYDFYSYICGVVNSCTTIYGIDGIADFYKNLSELTPKERFVDNETLIAATDIFDRTIKSISNSGYSGLMVFERLDLVSQRYFCFVGMFALLAKVQRIEARAAKVNNETIPSGPYYYQAYRDQPTINQ